MFRYYTIIVTYDESLFSIGLQATEVTIATILTFFFFNKADFLEV